MVRLRGEGLTHAKIGAAIGRSWKTVCKVLNATKPTGDIVADAA